MRDLLTDWKDLMPHYPRLGEELLARWDEPHRHYHDAGHLDEALNALVRLGGSSLTEHLAIWFHDAVWQGEAGSDERASADLARQCLAEILPHEAAEVARLVMITLDHAPEDDDLVGQRVSDADLAVLGSEPERYQASVGQIRAEYARFTDDQWRDGRRSVLGDLLGRPFIYHTPLGRRWWEEQARANLEAELSQLGDPHRALDC